MTEQESKTLVHAFDLIRDGLDIIRKELLTPIDLRDNELDARRELIRTLEENRRLKAAMILMGLYSEDEKKERES